MEDFSEAEQEREPEAMIVDVEDVVEETASPLAKFQPHQTPVYSVAGSETTSIAIPLGTVTARHEPSPPVILIQPGEFHPSSSANPSSFNVNEILPLTSNAVDNYVISPSSSSTYYAALVEPSAVEQRQHRLIPRKHLNLPSRSVQLKNNMKVT